MIEMDKYKALEEIKKDLTTVCDNLKHPIDNGIYHALSVLIFYGFKTTGSCEGHSDWGLQYPWIDVDQGSRRSNEFEVKMLDHYISSFIDTHPAFLKKDFGIDIAYNGNFRFTSVNLYSMNKFVDFLIEEA